jgi:hypothetical protein
MKYAREQSRCLGHGMGPDLLALRAVVSLSSLRSAPRHFLNETAPELMLVFQNTIISLTIRPLNMVDICNTTLYSQLLATFMKKRVISGLQLLLLLLLGLLLRHTVHAMRQW